MSLRSIFDAHCEGLMSLEQFAASMESIKQRLPRQLGDANCRSTACKEQDGLLRVFMTHDKHSSERLEWDKFHNAVRECVDFHLERNVQFDRLFGLRWNAAADDDDDESMTTRSSRSRSLPRLCPKRRTWRPSTMCCWSRACCRCRMATRRTV